MGTNSLSLTEVGEKIPLFGDKKIYWTEYLQVSYDDRYFIPMNWKKRPTEKGLQPYIISANTKKTKELDSFLYTEMKKHLGDDYEVGGGDD